MTKSGFLFTVDGMIKMVSPKNESDGFRLEELYAMLSCDLVEVVYPQGTFQLDHAWESPILICDENGLGVKRLNRLATLVAGFPIVGDCLMCESEQFK